MSDGVLVRVPASSANLGPGFDCLAAALDLQLELEVSRTGRFEVLADLPVEGGRENLCVRAFSRLASPEGLTFRIRSQIPLSGGLGSSAAAIVAGLTAAERMFGLDIDLLTEATAIEGHPDNVAAAVNGGMVVCAEGRAVRIDPPAGLELIAVVPDRPVRTSAARSALPSSVPLADAVFNVAHASLLMLGLAREEWDLVALGLRDRLHERHRRDLFPRSFDLAREAPDLGALGATISGAGPTVLVWCLKGATETVTTALSGRIEGWATLLRTPLASLGAHVLPAMPRDAGR